MGGALAALVLVIALAFTPSARAQAVVCSEPAYPGFVGSGFLGISPASPGVDQPVAIAAGVQGFMPTGITAQLQGNTIIATLSGNYLIIGLPPPWFGCLTTAIGALAAGVYTVEAYVVDTSLPGVPPALFASAPLVVGATPQSIPSVSMPVLVALLLMVLLSGVRARPGGGLR